MLTRLIKGFSPPHEHFIEHFTCMTKKSHQIKAEIANTGQDEEEEK
jgi:hypothetical protein